MLNNYCGIFDCFYANKGTVKTIVMAGDFTGDELFKFTEVIKKDFVDSFISNGIKHERESYYGSRSL